ncbi:MAG TPA: universal stress protein [Flavisolibacter sp.]|jgi:nucleotide-binding universal stress UspA family protein|nr:universal stress protein [Flavisolibacter sp.]
MKKIMVAFDFTPASRNAAVYACQLAERFQAVVHLVHVYNEPLPSMVGPEAWVVAPGTLQQEMEVRMKEEIRQLNTTVLVSAVVINGFRSESLTMEAEEYEADLVVMGSKSRANRIFGSTCIRMMRKCGRPLLLVPESFTYRPAKNMVLAVDFREKVSQKDLVALVSLFKVYDASLRVVHVDPPMAEMNVSEVSEKLQLGLALSSVTYVYDRVENDDVDSGLFDYLDRHPCDLLVMMAHQHSFINRMVSLSHTRVVGSMVKLPLLVLHNQPA